MIIIVKQDVLRERGGRFQSTWIFLEMTGSQGGAKVKLALERREDHGLPRESKTMDDLRSDKRDIQGINYIELTVSQRRPR